jgi:polysaccharide export outer membrane protein
MHGIINRIFLGLILVLFTGSLIGCSGPSQAQPAGPQSPAGSGRTPGIYPATPSTQNAQAPAVAPPAGTNLAQIGGADYRLGVGDRVKIVVFGQADLTNETEVDATGKIAMALIGDIQAVGRTAREVETEIRTRLDKDFLVNPKVSVLIVAYRPITILGQVKNPGRYPYSAGMDIRQAVALAGGYDRRGSTSSATIYRNNQELEVPPETKVQPGDTIEIPRRFF